MKGVMKEGNEIQFISSVNGYGVTSLIKKLIPNEFILFSHDADTKESGQQEREKEWTGGTESYSLIEKNGVTTLIVKTDVPQEQEEIFNIRFPRALERIKTLAEKMQKETVKDFDYQTLHQALQSLIRDEPDALANLSNSAALLYHGMDEINWAGFYLLRENELVLGPFQGKLACTRIALGRGVCGTAAENREAIVVQDVHEFPGHIACDEASASEIVIPIISDGRLIGVLDVDSPVKGRFSETDRQYLQGFVDILSAHIRWQDLIQSGSQRG
jgi:GAF domain-containing protein